MRTRAELNSIIELDDYILTIILIGRLNYFIETNKRR